MRILIMIMEPNVRNICDKLVPYFTHCMHLPPTFLWNNRRKRTKL